MQNLGSFNPMDIQKYLQGVTWPVGKDDLVTVLRNNGAPNEIVSKLQGSSKGTFNSPEDVMSEVQSGL